jgi:hypothetical protein
MNFFLFFISFRSVDVKNFQSKFKRAEEQASKMSLPGAHSDGDGDLGESIPEWVAIFKQFWEFKKSHPSKSAQEEQRREVRRTMQRTILPPVQPLGEATNQIVNETSASRSRQATSNSLIVEGGNMIVLPASNSTATTPRPMNVRRVSTGSQSRRTSGLVTNSTGSDSHREISSFMEAMNASNRSLFRRSYKEVLEDYDMAKQRLAQARADNDDDDEKLYSNLLKKLETELYSSA